MHNELINSNPFREILSWFCQCLGLWSESISSNCEDSLDNEELKTEKAEVLVVDYLQKKYDLSQLKALYESLINDEDFPLELFRSDTSQFAVLESVLSSIINFSAKEKPSKRKKSAGDKFINDWLCVARLEKVVIADIRRQQVSLNEYLIEPFIVFWFKYVNQVFADDSKVHYFVKKMTPCKDGHDFDSMYSALKKYPDRIKFLLKFQIRDLISWIAPELQRMFTEINYTFLFSRKSVIFAY